MISHSEGLQIWKSIFDHEEPFPFSSTLRAMKGSPIKLIPSIQSIWRYFHTLEKTEKPPTKEEFDEVSNTFFALAPYIPYRETYDLLMDEDKRYTRLRDYFSQMKNYTPINKLTGRRFFT